METSRKLRKTLNKAFRETANLPPSFPTQLWTQEELEADLDQGSVSLEELNWYCFNVSTVMSRQLVSLHFLACSYIFGVEMDKGLDGKRMSEVFQAAENYAAGEQASVESLLAFFPGLALAEIDFVLTNALNFAKFKLKLDELIDRGERVDWTEASGVVRLLHGDDETFKHVVVCEVIADLLVRKAAFLRRAGRMNAASGARALASIRKGLSEPFISAAHSLGEWSDAIPHDEPVQVESKVIDGVKAFVYKHKDKLDDVEIGTRNLKKESFLDPTGLRRAARNQLRDFEKFKSNWSIPAEPAFFKSGRPKDLENLLKSQHPVDGEK